MWAASCKWLGSACPEDPAPEPRSLYHGARAYVLPTKVHTWGCPEARLNLTVSGSQFCSLQPNPETAEERFRTAATRMAARGTHDRRADAEQRRQLRGAKKVRSAAVSGSGSPTGCFRTLKRYICRLAACACVAHSVVLNGAGQAACGCDGGTTGVATLGTATAEQSGGGAASGSSDDE